LPLCLSSVSHNAEKFPIKVDDVRWIFQEIARTLSIKSESDQTFFHNDLNPSNIMLTTDFKPKLIDFAIARWKDGPQSAVEEGTVAYMVGLHCFIVADTAGARGV
jgi:serine/threonine protein kinase